MVWIVLLMYIVLYLAMLIGNPILLGFVALVELGVIGWGAYKVVTCGDYKRFKRTRQYRSKGWYSIRRGLK